MAQPLTVTLPHQLGRAEARRRIDEGLAQFVGQIAGMAQGYRQVWTDDRLDFEAMVMGQMLKGSIAVLDAAVRVEVVLPGLLGLMSGKIREKLQRQGQILLDKK